MDRRKFFQLAGLTGLAVAAPFVVSRSRAAAPFGGPFLVQVHASGAWDPTLLFNPTLRTEHNTLYTDTRTVGPFSCPALAADPAQLGLDGTYGYEQYLMTPEAFLTKYSSRLTVLNGIDTTTNNHETGTRAMWSGRLTEGYPALGALYAATVAADRPVPFLSGGGYDATAELVALSRVSNASAVRKLAFPNTIDPTKPPAEQTFYHTAATTQRIAAAQAERLQAARSVQHLPRVKAAMGSLLLARTSAPDLGALRVPDALLDIPGYQLGDLENFAQQAQLAVSAFQSGVAAAASLALTGFDSHSNHNRDQPRQIMKLLWGIDFLMEQARAAGIDGQLVVVACSDFGRGPFYNGTGTGSGKDHWPITSAFALGAGIAGGRLIGGTDADQKPRDVDPSTLAAVDAGQGVRIGPGHVQRALRAKLAIATGAPAGTFALAGEDLALFG